MSKISVRQIFFYLLSVFIGLLFVYGAWAKLKDIEPFEWSLAETGFFSFTAANIFTRIFIAAEIFIGLLFIGCISLNKTVYTIAAVLLTLFNIYLLWILFVFGNNGNCGCFGNALSMLPLQAYLKNIGLILLIYCLSIWQYKFAIKSNKRQLIALALLALTYTCVKQAPDFIFIKEKETVSKHAINLDNMYTADASKAPSFNYKQGKHIISILSTSCVFCKKAARKLHTMQIRNAHFPFYNVILGDSVETQNFLKESLADNIPYQINKNIPYFYKLANNRLPSIIWLQDGQV